MVCCPARETPGGSSPNKTPPVETGGALNGIGSYYSGHRKRLSQHTVAHFGV